MFEGSVQVIITELLRGRRGHRICRQGEMDVNGRLHFRICHHDRFGYNCRNCLWDTTSDEEEDWVIDDETPFTSPGPSPRIMETRAREYDLHVVLQKATARAQMHARTVVPRLCWGCSEACPWFYMQCALCKRPFCRSCSPYSQPGFSPDRSCADCAVRWEAMAGPENSERTDDLVMAQEVHWMLGL